MFSPTRRSQAFTFRVQLELRLLVHLTHEGDTRKTNWNIRDSNQRSLTHNTINDHGLETSTLPIELFGQTTIGQVIKPHANKLLYIIFLNNNNRLKINKRKLKIKKQQLLANNFFWYK